MVGVLGDNGKMRLTWLVNFDFGGLIPSSFMRQMLVAFMAYPVATIEAVEKEKKQSSIDDARGESGGDRAEAEASVSSTSALLKTIAELKALRKKDSFKISEGASKISKLEAEGKKYLSDISGLETQGKRYALQISEDAVKITGLEGEVSTLRRRLARLRAGEDEEHSGE